MNNSNATSLGMNKDPSIVYTIATHAGEKNSIINMNFYHKFYIVVIITQHIAYLSYSINFFLYSFCGMKFRKELMKYLSRYGKYRRQIQTTRIVSL